MRVELIPVIEADTRRPEVVAALDTLVPFTPNLHFYRAADLTPELVAVLAKAHLQGFFNGEWPIEQCCSFFGGYVLSIDGRNVLFPQCCGELSDIIYWKYVAKYGRDAYYNGHPAPEATFTDDEVVLHCQDEHDPFQPATSPEIRVPKAALSAAYDETLRELVTFAGHLETVQQQLRLPVASITHLLIYHNAEFPDELP